jgi:acyl-CoA thioesterase-1
VLLIGDSISIGYTLPVREQLRGVANVHRPAQNCGPTQMGLVDLDGWLGGRHWDLIHFNFGLHDLKYITAEGEMSDPVHGHQLSPLPVYEKNLRALVARLKRTGAKLIYATTTPVPAGCGFRVEGDERYYNAAAVRIMRENGIAIDDLAAVVKPQQAKIQNPNDVHFTPEGSRILGAAVAASIRAGLAR